MADAGTSIAKTPEDYLAVMIDRAQQLGSRISDFTIGSAARTFAETLAAGLSMQSGVGEQLRLNSYLATATGDALDRKAADYQVQRIAAVQAAGQVTITRAATGAAVTIPAGWGQLSTVPQSGQTPVLVVTVADAVFASTDTAISVDAVAVTGGKAGNLPPATPLLALVAVDGFDSSTGYAVSASPFTNGVDAESDDALRARVPVEVAGRVIGRKAAFLAAALRVPGVTSANVLQAGDARGDATFVPANNVEIYWDGPAGAAAQVASEIANATMSGQAATPIAATAVRTVAALTVYCAAGTDTVALAASVSQLLQDAVNAVGVGGTARVSLAVEALHSQAPQVEAVQLPFADFRRFTDAPGTSADIAMKPVEYPTLAAADVTVTVTPL